MPVAVQPTVPCEMLPPLLIETIKAAVETTFHSILGEKPTLVSPEEQPPGVGGVVGIISFVGELAWSYSLILPETTAPAMIQRFVGFEIPYDSPDMGDAVGELANVLAGDVVARLESKRFKAQMSLPTVARGHDVELIAPGGVPTARMFFNSQCGRFWFKLSAARPGGFSSRIPGK